MIYKVTKQFSGGREQPCQQFKTLKEAKDHATTAAAENALMKINVIYRVYEFDDLIDTVDSSKVVPTETTSGSSDDEAGGGKQSGATFQPTPFAKAPQPKGSPPKWLIDPDEDEKDKEK